MIHFKVKHLACIKGKQFLFRDLNFELSSGELLLVQGANGSGKSSLLKILAGLASSEQGVIENKSEIAYLGHKIGIKKGLTIWENIAFQLILSKQRMEEMEFQSTLRSFGLEQEPHRLCASLSMGQQRKVALSALILKRKPIWIVDEPFTGLDKKSTKVLCEIFLAHLATGGIVIVASHSVDELSPHQRIELAPC